MDKKKYSEALSLALKLQKQFPNNPSYLQHLIVIYEKLEAPEGRAKTLAQLIDSAPAVVVQETCSSQVRRNEFDLLQKCLARLPDDVDTLLAAARIEIEVGRLAEARVHLNHALELTPKYPDLHIGLGKLAEKEGRRDEAAENYRHALKLRPNDPEIQKILEGFSEVSQ